MIVFNDRELLALRKAMNHYYFICKEFQQPFNATLDKVLAKLDIYYLKKSFAKELENEKENN